MKSYPVRIATQADNQAILEYYNSAPIAGGDFRLRSRRDPNFFSLLEMQGDVFRAFIYEEDGKILGVGTLSVRQGYVQGELKRVGYLGDFRVQFNRKTLKIWRKIYSDVLLAAPLIEDFQGCNDWLTAVFDSNSQAQKAFINPRPRRLDFQLRYDLLTNYNMVNVLKRLWKSRPVKMPGVKTRWAGPADRESLLHFIDQTQRTQAFGISGVEWDRRLKIWPGLSIDHFLLAEKSSQIIGCMAAFNPHLVKRNIVERIPGYWHWLWPWLHLPKKNEALNVEYITGLNFSLQLSSFERSSLFKILFDQIYERFHQPDVHFIAFCSFAGTEYEHSLTNYVKQKIPMSLYSVGPVKSSTLNDDRTSVLQPGFEMAST